LFLSLCLLLIASAPAPTSSATITPTILSDAELQGRNCGGTSLLAALTHSGVPNQTGGEWTVGGALDANPAAFFQVRPSVAVAPSGEVFFVWQESRSGDSGDIYAAALGSDLGTSRRAARVDDTGNTAIDQAAPSLAIDSNGILHTVWQDERDGSADLFFASSQNAGRTWSANTAVSATVANQESSEPALLAAPDGSLLLAWRSTALGRSNIFFSRYTDDEWSTAARLNDASQVASRSLPRLTLDGDGGLLAAWEDRRSGDPEIYIAQLNSLGGEWGDERRISAAGVVAARPDLATAPDGTLYLVYQGESGIFLQRSADRGVTWTTAQRIDDGDGNAFTNPQIAVDANGGVHCIWCRLRTNVVADIVAAYSADGGAAWQAPVILAGTTGTADPLALSAASDGKVYAAWSDDGSGAQQLHSAVWNPVEEPREFLYLPLIRR
jgi:hypothetical protein